MIDRWTGPVRFQFMGDKYAASTLQNVARKELGVLRNLMGFQNLQQDQRTVHLSNGIVVNVQIVFGQARANIFVPVHEPRPEELTWPQPEKMPEIELVEETLRKLELKETMIKPRIAMADANSDLDEAYLYIVDYGSNKNETTGDRNFTVKGSYSWTFESLALDLNPGFGFDDDPNDSRVQMLDCSWMSDSKILLSARGTFSNVCSTDGCNWGYALYEFRPRSDSLPVLVLDMSEKYPVFGSSTSNWGSSDEGLSYYPDRNIVKYDISHFIAKRVAQNDLSGKENPSSFIDIIDKSYNIVKRITWTYPIITEARGKGRGAGYGMSSFYINESPLEAAISRNYVLVRCFSLVHDMNTSGGSWEANLTQGESLVLFDRESGNRISTLDLVSDIWGYIKEISITNIETDGELLYSYSTASCIHWIKNDEFIVYVRVSVGGLSGFSVSPDDLPAYTTLQKVVVSDTQEIIVEWEFIISDDYDMGDLDYPSGEIYSVVEHDEKVAIAWSLPGIAPHYRYITVHEYSTGELVACKDEEEISASAPVSKFRIYNLFYDKHGFLAYGYNHDTSSRDSAVLNNDLTVRYMLNVMTSSFRADKTLRLIHKH